MGSRRNLDESIDETQKVYKKPVLKRHGTVSELTAAGSRPGPLNSPDNYLDYDYS